MAKFDATDVAILDLIQRDSRMTIKEIAGKLNLSTTPIFERLKRLEKQGVIKKYVAILDSKKLGKKLTAFIHISILDHSAKGLDDFVAEIMTQPEVIECHNVTGDSDFFLKIVVEDIEKYNEYLRNKLSKVPNIRRLKSSFSLSVKKETTAYELQLENLPRSY